MADLEKRRTGMSRQARERHAYRLVQAGALTGSVGVVTLVLAVVGVVSAGVPVILLLLTALAVWRFLRVTGTR